MPVHIEEDHPDCDGFAVVDDEGNMAEGGCHKNKKDALAHMQAMNMNMNSHAIRSGRVLSRANENKLRDAVAAIVAVLEQLGDEENGRDAHPGQEHRTYDMTQVEVRAEGDEPVITGYASVFNRKSLVLYDFREVILPGAFAGTLDRNPDVRALWNHDPAAVLGRTTNGTLRLWEDNTGLGFELRPANTQVGRDAIELIRRGDVSQMSFGFTLAPGNDEWSRDTDGMMLRQIAAVDQLHEVSPVTWPAYPDTIATLRNAPEWVQRALLPSGVDHSETTEVTRAREILSYRIKIQRER